MMNAAARIGEGLRPSPTESCVFFDSATEVACNVKRICESSFCAEKSLFDNCGFSRGEGFQNLPYKNITITYIGF